MITQSFAERITKKIKFFHIFIFLIFIKIIGQEINYFEPYPNFQILFPILLLMFFFTVLLLKNCLKQLLELKEQCEKDNTIECALTVLFENNNNFVILFLYGLIILIYFICLFKLQFVEFNIMGVYILF